MTLSETIELIEKAMEGVTPGPWTVDDERDDYEISIVGRPTWKCTRFGVEGEWDVAQIEIINDRDAETQANAADTLGSLRRARTLLSKESADDQG